MDYESKWSEMEKRLNLQSISEFVQYGSDIREVDRHNFTERAETAYKKLQEEIESICGKETAQDILDKIVVYSGIREDIYFTLGMKVGAKMIILLTNNLETDF